MQKEEVHKPLISLQRFNIPSQTECHLHAVQCQEGTKAHHGSTTYTQLVI